MFKKLFILSCVLFVIGTGAAAVSAQNWVDLGSREVKDRSEQDTWHIGKSKGEFNAIRITVQKRPVRFYRLKVTYDNGRSEEFQIANNIRAGGETRVLDLTGHDRYIDKVDVWYEANTARRGVRSQVTLYGRH